MRALKLFLLSSLMIGSAACQLQTWSSTSGTAANGTAANGTSESEPAADAGAPETQATSDPPPPKSEPKRANMTPDQAAIAALGDVVVVEHLKGFVDDDSFDLEKIQAAFLAAPPELFVHVVDEKWSQGTSVLHVYQPTPKHKPSRFSHGGKADWSIAWKHGQPTLTRKLRYPDLEAGTPALLWSRRGTRGYILVTGDGGRYRVSDRATPRGQKTAAPTLRVGLSPAKTWPETIPNQVLFLTDIQYLEEEGTVRKGTLTEFKAAQKAARQCSERVWAAAKPKFDALERQNVTRATRRNRISQLQEKVSAQQHRECDKHADEARSLIASAVSAFTERRQAVWDAVRPRLEKIAP